MTTCQYIAVLTPDADGWLAVIPDLPGTGVQGDSVHEAIEMVTEEAMGWLEIALYRGGTVPPARSREEIREDHNWAREFRIDWTNAVMSIVQVELADNDP